MASRIHINNTLKKIYFQLSKWKTIDCGFIKKYNKYNKCHQMFFFKKNYEIKGHLVNMSHFETLYINSQIKLKY